MDLLLPTKWAMAPTHMKYLYILILMLILGQASAARDLVRKDVSHESLEDRNGIPALIVTSMAPDDSRVVGEPAEFARFNSHLHLESNEALVHDVHSLSTTPAGSRSVIYS